MKRSRATIQFCGFGGQGLVLSSVILGTAVVTRAGLNAVQTQSYGSEARGGECQAELILAQGAIFSPLAEDVQVLVAMSQSALGRYLERLEPGGALIIDPELVQAPARTDIQILPVPATEIASRLGVRVAANMVMLGFLQQATGLLPAEALFETIRENVPSRFVEVNLAAAREGMALASGMNASVEI